MNTPMQNHSMLHFTMRSFTSISSLAFASMSSLACAVARAGHVRGVRALRAALLVAAVAAPIAPLDVFPAFRGVSLVTSASAQSQRDMMGGPITTKRFERLSRAYLSPTDAELAALDGLHETYLEKFRLELDPELAAIGASMGNGMPTKAEFDKFLRDVDRLNGRVADADNVFLNAAAELIAEDRRGGFNRIRDARERQRLLSGLARFAPMMFGGGGSFVDLSDLVIQPKILAAVTDEQRELFGSILGGIEARLTSQARSYNARMREGMSKFFDVMQSMQGVQAAPADADPEAEMARMQGMQTAYVTAMAEIGGEFRKAVRSNFTANRESMEQLAAVLPAPMVVDLRTKLATKALGMVGAMGMMGGRGMGRGGEVSAIVSRIRRDESISAEVKQQANAILVTWRSDNADALESFAQLMVASDSNPMMEMMGGAGEASESFAGITAASEKIQSAANTAFKALHGLLGGENNTYVTKYSSRARDGADTVDAYRGVAEVKAAEPDAIPEVRMQGIDQGVITATTSATVMQIFRTLGNDAAVEGLTDAVVQAWLDDEWKPRVEPLQATIWQAKVKVYSASSDGRVEYDLAAVAQVQQARQALVAAAFELDAKLETNLASALGINADDLAFLLLRLERLALVLNKSNGMESPMVGSVLNLLVSAKLDPATSVAIMEASRAEFTTLASEFPVMTAARLENSRKTLEAEMGFSTRDSARVAAASADYSRLVQESTKLNGELGARVATIYDAACVAAVSDVDALASAKRARMRAMYPSIYRLSDSAERQLNASALFTELTDDQRGQIEALRAEYNVVYEMLSEQMVMPAFEGFPGDGSADAFQDYAKRQAEVEKVRFQRKELTEKSLNQLRRTLGSTLSAKVPGLVPDEDAELDEPTEGNWMKAEED
jgi:hypothetical protein